jgi:transcriptional regulator with XRE-family HTH domain
MTAAARLCLREVELGLSIRDLAKALGVYERYVYRWEAGGQGLNRETADKLAALVDYSNERFTAMVEASEPGTVITIYRNDEEFRAHVDTGPWTLPASWHRKVAWRAAKQTGATVAYRS